MLLVSLLLLIIAFVLFLFAAFSVTAPPRLNWIGLGLACCTLSVLLQSPWPVLR